MFPCSVEFEKKVKTWIVYLNQVHGSWLPHWLAVHWVHFQTVAGPHWDAHGKPVLEKVTQKVLFPIPYPANVSKLMPN